MHCTPCRPWSPSVGEGWGGWGGGLFPGKGGEPGRSRLRVDHEHVLTRGVAEVHWGGNRGGVSESGGGGTGGAGRSHGRELEFGGGGEKGRGRVVFAGRRARDRVMVTDVRRRRDGILQRNRVS